MRRDGGLGFAAGGLAGAAGLGADAAVFVPPGVTLAFGGAERGGAGAEAQRLGCERLVRAGAASGEARRGVADVGAIEIEPDALAKLGDHVLGEARIGA